MASKPGEKKRNVAQVNTTDVLKCQPDFIKGYLKDYQCTVVDGAFLPCLTTAAEKEMPPPLQQSDLLKPLYMDVMKHGLKYAAHNWPEKSSKVSPDKAHSSKDNTLDADVIIVGAGIAGLAVAYELERANVSVLLLEQTNRVGGRVYTFGEKEGLAKGLYGEAGAMRLPCDKDTPVDKMIHYLTDFYIDKFNLTKAKFDNYNENAYYSFYGMEKKRAKDWTTEDFDQLWPNWFENISQKYRKKIKNIDDYYSYTTAVVTNQLRNWLKKSENSIEKADAWNRWIGIWCRFTLEGFLLSSYDAVIAKIPIKDNQKGLEDLKRLLPWPDIAVRGYSVFSYTVQLDQSLVQFLREEMGQWWMPDMHCIDGGMSKLPEAFANSKPNDEELLQKIHTNRTVNRITYTYNPDNPGEDLVEIDGCYTDTKFPLTAVKGRAVIVTTSVNILRLITFKSANDSYPPPTKFYQAIEDIFMGASTKIFLQTKTRFWENEGITGGFSKTNLPVGQIHYCRHDGTTEKGLLLVYTWKSEALMFGSVHKDTALREAIEQVATIHPQIKEQYESGLVHAWCNQPNTQGAYEILKPIQFQNVQFLRRPMHNVYFAAEGISTAPGWIQGALESALKSAYECYIRYENVV